MEEKRFLVVTGPTASGKSAVALALAETVDIEIISCDSMLVYKRMNIGTDKPSPEDLSRVRHHMIDIREPWEHYDVATYRREAEEAVESVLRKGRLPVVVGGTPMYLKALLYGLFDGPPANPQLRRELKEEASRRGTPALWEELKRVDPAAAARIHPNDLRRIVRAIEVFRTTGRTISSLQQEWKKASPRGDALVVVLQMDRKVLYERIDARVDRMMERGLLEEVKSLRGLLGPTARAALGYREILEHLEGRYSLEEAVQRIKTNTHKFVRRQTTWFRSMEGLQPVSVRPGEWHDAAERIIEKMEHAHVER